MSVVQESQGAVVYPRRVTLITDPYINATNYMPWVLGQDNRGYQYQIALDAIPPGFDISQVKQNQIWFVENTTAAYRLSLYAGTISGAITASGGGIYTNSGTSTTTSGETGYYISAYDTTTQTVANATTAYPITINTFAEGNGITLGASGQLYVENTAVYNLQFSVQLTHTGANVEDANIWLRMAPSGTVLSGTSTSYDVAYSNGQVGVPAKHAGTNGHTIAAWNYVMTISGGQYVQLWWQPESTDISMATLPAGTTPTTPITPSIIVTMQQVTSMISGGGSGGSGVSGITQLTGDVTTASGSGAQAATLVGTTAVSGVVNTIVNANTTVTGKVSNTTVVTGTVGQITGGGTLASNQTLGLATAGPGSGALSTTAAQTPNITIDAYGRVISVVNSNIAIAENQVTNLTSDLGAKFPYSGGTVSGNLIVASGFTVSGTSTYIGNTTFSGTVSVSGVSVLTSISGITASGDLTGTYPNPTLAVNRLALSGGTMSGAITMGSNRITGLPIPGASTDPLVASQSMGAPSPLIHAGGSYPMKAWNADPANCSLAVSSVAMTSQTEFFSAITIPYPMTLNQIWIYQITGAAYQATNPYYALGIYDTSGNLLASTGNLVSGGFTGLTGPLGWSLSASYAIAQGNYMIGFLYYSGTGAGSPTTPALGRLTGNNAAQINMNCPTPSAGKLDQRCCSTGSRTTLASPMTATPVQSATNFWVGMA